MIVGETSRMHEHPSNLCLCHLAVVSEEPTTTALGKLIFRMESMDKTPCMKSHLIVHSDTVEDHIDGVSGAGREK